MRAVVADWARSEANPILTGVGRSARLAEYYMRRIQRNVAIHFRLPKVARPHSLPRRKDPEAAAGVAVVAIVKNEGTNIGEWVQFHSRVGFDRFYIYDNGSTDDTVDQLRHLAGRFDLTILPWKSFDATSDAQFLAYNHALAQYGPFNRWIAFVDLDEFLFPIDDRSMGETLRDYEDVPAVSVPWVMYGSSGHLERPSGRMTENFLMRAPFPPPRHRNTLLNYKSIVRAPFVHSMTKHFPVLIDEPAHFYNERKQRLHKREYVNPEFAVSEIFRLNHYFSRSRNEMMAKVAHGPISGRSRRWRKLDRFLTIEEETVQDDIILSKWKD